MIKDPLEFLDDELDIHDYFKCKKEKNYNCSYCNHRADQVYADYKKETYDNGGIRLKKIYVETMKHIFGPVITKRARDRYNSNEHYKKLHTNKIPCSCETRKHNECDGFKTNPLTYELISCNCHRHTKTELKEFRTKLPYCRGI